MRIEMICEKRLEKSSLFKPTYILFINTEESALVSSVYVLEIIESQSTVGDLKNRRYVPVPIPTRTINPREIWEITSLSTVTEAEVTR